MQTMQEMRQHIRTRVQQDKSCQVCQTKLDGRNVVVLVSNSGSATICGCCADTMPSMIASRLDNVTIMDGRDLSPFK